MHTFSKLVTLFGVGILLAGIAHAQQTPAAKSPAAPAAKPHKAPVKTATPAAAKRSGAAVLKTEAEKFSYALGMNLGTSMRKESIALDPNLFLQGLRASMAGGKTLLTDEEARAALMAMQNELRTKMQAKMQAEGAANKTEGDEFLAANKAKEGVVTLPSGLEYKILKEGTGPKPTTGDTVVCNYRGTLINGKEFDSSYQRGQPATFPVTGVIKGWTEALQLMPVGSKWQLFVPATLAYGERAMGEDIGPNSTLIFDVELLSIQEKPKTEPAKPQADEKK